MIRNRTTATFAAVASLLLVFGACGSDSDPTGPGTPASDFGGNWSISLEVTAKGTCFNTIGTQINENWTIVQDGNLAILEASPRDLRTELTVNGDRLTGSGDVGSDETYDVSLSIANGDVSGTLTFSDPSESCTESYSVSGQRTNTPPTSEFAGSWELDLEVTYSTCIDEPAGSTDLVCRVIEVNGNTVSIVDDEGAIRGVGNGQSAALRRNNSEENLLGNIAVSGNTLSGSVSIFNFTDKCQVDLDISGTRLEEGCPPPPSVNDFLGNWYVQRTGFSRTGLCAEATAYFGECFTVSGDASSLTVDSAGFGVLTGPIEDFSAELSRSDLDGLATLSLSLEQGVLVGTFEKIFTSGLCDDVSIEFEGVALPLPCDQSGGPFAGSWDLQATVTENGCLLGPPSDCTNIFQNGNVLIIDNELVATANGNSASHFSQEEFAGYRWTETRNVQVDAGGTMLTGDQSIVRENLKSQETCTSSATFAGTPGKFCDPDFAAGSSSLGFRPAMGLFHK